MERQRRVGRKMIWMKWILLPAVCHHTLCISQPYRLVNEKTTCLEFKVESRLSCSRSDQFYHCLLDENYTKEFEVCRDWKWIPGGKCAYFNSYGIGNIDERDCISSSTLQCATDQYRSDLNTRYSACYVKKRIAITTPINTPTIKSTGSGTADVQNTTETAPTESTPAESTPFNSSAIGIALGAIVPLILLVVVPGILLFKKRRRRESTSQRETAVERGEGDALMNTETKCLAENEQNQQLIEKDEGTSTEDKESSPLLAENKNENQSEGQLKENFMKNERISVSQNYDSPQKNESFKTPPTTPAVQTEPDTDIGRTENKDDKKTGKKEVDGSHGGHDSSEEVSPGVGAEKKKEEGSIEKGHSPDVMSPDNGKEDDSHSSPVNDKNSDNGKQKTKVTEEDQSEEKESGEDTYPQKDAVGIFVDSLESITKEDDGEGGWNEIQELLEYMCTVPARKILFNVMKMYVDKPGSYYQDELKMASVKTVLPPEYHSAIDSDSEYRRSIPVIYTILQVSLSEDHQPKSGWGQKVKDTDTGVGDDIERVYQAHTLHREIQNPEEIYVDGYVRLFEMLIGAVKRLDIKGKCNEDYREIVRRWENIQRKLWVKDKWKTFTNFIKKLSD
ncbi:uncharacterized protein LOC125664388 [Ostrea edulis]|uniref:uncharacterized protein LOC125664388 n=1 Tax=Ostrea edulis TaxID=37623 RepID=UPI0024AFF38F|nr:uncharacterized protein LOC125664388 [Ostrea edulis]